MFDFSHGVVKMVLIGAFSLCLLMSFQILFLFFPLALWSGASFLVFGLFVSAMARFLPVPFLLLLPYIFFRATTLVSGIAIESGGYMKEIETLGEPTGAYIRLTSIYIIFISFSAIIIEWVYARIKFKDEKLSHIRERTQRHPWVWIFYGVFILFSMYVLSIGFSKGFPFLNNIDRFTFRDEIGGRGFLLYMGNRVLSAYLFGLIIFLCHGIRRYMAIILFLSMIVISVLFGEKFSSLMASFIYVLMPAYLISQTLQRRIFSQVIPAIASVAVLTIPIVLMVYGWAEKPQEAIEKLSTRMVGQGEVWFVADSNEKDAFNFEREHINHIVVSTVSSNANEMITQEPYIGAVYFMHEYLPPALLSLFLESPSLTLTYSFEAYLLVAFGWIGMFLPLLFYAGIHALTLLYLCWSIQNARPVSIFFAGKLLAWMIVGLSQGYLFMIFGFKIFVLVGLAIIYEIFSSILSKKRAGSV